MNDNNISPKEKEEDEAPVELEVIPLTDDEEEAEEEVMIPERPKAQPQGEYELAYMEASNQTDPEYNIKNANNTASQSGSGGDFANQLAFQTMADTNHVAWRDAYFKLMDRSIKDFHALLQLRNWQKIDPPQKCPCPHVDLFEKKGSPSQGFYTLKVESILKCRKERIHYLIRDHDLETRMRWDGDNLVDVGQCRSYLGSQEQVDVVYSRVNVNIKGVYDRYFLGIRWNSYNQENDSYTHVFRSTTYDSHRVPDDTVNVICSD